jgi:hypothetical protein
LTEWRPLQFTTCLKIRAQPRTRDREQVRLRATPLATSARRRFDEWHTGDEARGDFHLRRRDHLLCAARNARNAAAHQLRCPQTADDGEFEGIGAHGSSNHWDLSCFWGGLEPGRGCRLGKAEPIVYLVVRFGELMGRGVVS